MASLNSLGRIDAVVGFADCSAQVAELATLLDVPREIASVHVFPDGESLIQVHTEARHVAVYRSLHHPNPKLFDVILTASALRDLGASQLTLIAPYLPYMRQDIAFAPGQGVSQRVVGELLGAAFDGFVTVDPHLHRTRTLGSVFCGKPSLSLSAATAIADHAHTNGHNMYGLVVGPDEESGPFVRRIGDKLGVKYAVAQKNRHGDRQVTISIPSDLDVMGQAILVADDVISTGSTIAAVARALKSKGARRIDAYAAHALCDEKAVAALHAAGIDRIISTDSIPHNTNDISVACLIARGLGENKEHR